MKVLSNKKYKAEIQASYTEGQKSVSDALYGIFYNPTSLETSHRNNYITYEQQVNELYKMYYAESDLGNDTTATIIDLRTAIICGEGLSVIAKNKKTLKFINHILDYTGLNSEKLLSLVRHGELEGKQLLQLKIDKTKQQINIKQRLFYNDKYKIELENDEIKEIYTEKETVREYIPLDSSIFVKLAGMPDEYNKTPSKACSIVQQIKNHDKALYDMRASNHLYGYPIPAVKCETDQQVKTTSDQIIKTKWKIGDMFVSTGTLSFPTPPNTNESLIRELSVNTKIISRRTGLPVHWLGWTDLMSNRATADDLAELIITGSKTERLIWIDKLKELIIKIMQMSIDNGFDEAIYDEDFTLDMPYISLQYLDKIANVWMPLQMSGVISMGQLRNKLPGINPEETEKLIDDEKEKNMENMQEFQERSNPLVKEEVKDE